MKVNASEVFRCLCLGLHTDKNSSFLFVQIVLDGSRNKGRLRLEGRKLSANPHKKGHPNRMAFFKKDCYFISSRLLQLLDISLDQTKKTHHQLLHWVQTL